LECKFIEYKLTNKSRILLVDPLGNVQAVRSWHNSNLSEDTTAQQACERI